MTRMTALVLAAVTLSACAPTPTPSPTPTAAFASEEEAFAAAEDTYRAYTNALSKVSLADPESLENVYVWLVDGAASTSRQTFSELSAEDFTVTGTTTFSNFDGNVANLDSGEIESFVCLDVTDVEVLDSAGNSIVSEDRPDLQPLRVIFTRANTATGLAIASTQPLEAEACVR